MNALRFGFRAVQENLRSLAVYAALALAISVGLILVRYVVGDVAFEDVLSPASLGMQALVAFVGAVAQTVAFTWMGQHLGRPLWKMSLQEGFQHFFGLWLFIQTLESALWVVCSAVAQSSSDDTLAVSLLLAFMPIFVSTTPVGATIMYQGRVTGSHLRHGAHILVDLLPQTLVIALFSGAALFLLLILSASTIEWARPLVSVVAVYIDVAVFAAVWSLCSYHEHASGDEDDLDF